MTQTFPTRGEAWAERELKKERRAGTEHYVLGQHHAEVESDGDGTAGILTYCSALGLVIVLMGKHPDTGEWVPITRWCRVIGLSVDYGVRNLPDDWELTDEMKAALEEAMP